MFLMAQTPEVNSLKFTKFSVWNNKPECLFVANAKFSLLKLLIYEPYYCYALARLGVP